MALSITQKTNTETPNSVYPFGDIKDDSGQNDGTPVNRSVYADFHQFFEKLMDAAGIVANGLPDNASNGFQLFESLKKFNTEQTIANNGIFRYDSDVLDITDADINSLSKRITASENNIYAQAEDGGDIKIFQISKATNTEIGSITNGGNAEYNGQSKDIFFDEASGMLYVLFQNGANPGVLVYNENLVYQPLLSVTNTGSTFTAEAIAVTDEALYICGDNGTNGHYILYPKDTLVKTVKTSSSIYLYEEIYINPGFGGSVYLIGTNGGDLFADVWLSGSSFSQVNLSGNALFGLAYLDPFANKFYSKGEAGTYTDEVMTETMIDIGVGSSSARFNPLDSFNLVGSDGTTYPLSDLVFYKNELYSIAGFGQIRKYIRTI